MKSWTEQTARVKIYDSVAAVFLLSVLSGTDEGPVHQNSVCQLSFSPPVCRPEHPAYDNTQQHRRPRPGADKDTHLHS